LRILAVTTFGISNSSQTLIIHFSFYLEGMILVAVLRLLT